MCARDIIMGKNALTKHDEDCLSGYLFFINASILYMQIDTSNTNVVLVE